MSSICTHKSCAETFLDMKEKFAKIHRSFVSVSDSRNFLLSSENLEKNYKKAQKIIII